MHNFQKTIKATNENTPLPHTKYHADSLIREMEGCSSSSGTGNNFQGKKILYCLEKS